MINLTISDENMGVYELIRKLKIERESGLFLINQVN